MLLCINSLIPATWFRIRKTTKIKHESFHVRIAFMILARVGSAQNKAHTTRRSNWQVSRIENRLKHETQKQDYASSSLSLSLSIYVCCYRRNKKEHDCIHFNLLLQIAFDVFDSNSDDKISEIDLFKLIYYFN